MRQRKRILVGFSAVSLGGTLLLVGTTAWVAWSEAIETERVVVADVARDLAEQTERIIIHARERLDELNASTLEPCSEAHLAAMNRVAFAAPEILSVGYWLATKRLCGAGFSEAILLKPPVADRIYDSGIIAWWPGRQTEVQGIPLFLMRSGRYDVALDPRVLLQAIPTRGREVGLWVESLRMAAVPWNADLPAPGSLEPGLTINRATGSVLGRFSLGSLFPIDVVVAEPMDQFWSRHASTVMVAVGVLLLVSTLWIYGMLRYIRHRLSLAAELRTALATGGVHAVYQPIVDIATGSCVGAEALVRWRRDDGEIMTPDTFVPLARRAGLMRQLTLVMLDAVLNDLAGFLRGYPHARISVNLDPADLQNPDLAEELTGRLRAKGVPAASIKLEITESGLVDGETARVINELRERGHEVAVDDFGTGYSSLSYLQTFALDTLKIDKAFVDAIGTESVTSPVIHHVIELAQDLELSIVAEGVETEEQAAWLRARGVGYAQGYLFARPLTPRRFEEFFGARQTAEVRVLRNGLRRLAWEQP